MFPTILDVKNANKLQTNKKIKIKKEIELPILIYLSL